MSFSGDLDEKTIIKGDTASLYAFAYNDDESPITQADVTSVNFTVRKPDGTQTTTAGSVNSEGTGRLSYTDTNLVGKYLWVAQFTFTTGERRSVTDEFFVFDPLNVAATTFKDQIASEVWMRIEDCFDSQEGGPWLRDRTLSYFDESKVKRFIPEGLVRVNSYPPITNFGLDAFTTFSPSTDPAELALDPNAKEPDSDRIIIVQATLLVVIRHLMRSYVEQYNPTGANVVWQDRRDYQQRWQAIYQIEEPYFKEMVALWKRNFLRYGTGSLLVHSKAGRLYGPGYNRAWSVGRGRF
jgi:hypothetical protein